MRRGGIQGRSERATWGGSWVGLGLGLGDVPRLWVPNLELANVEEEFRKERVTSIVREGDSLILGGKGLAPITVTHEDSVKTLSTRCERGEVRCSTPYVREVVQCLGRTTGI